MYGHQATGVSCHRASSSTKNSWYWLRTGSRYPSRDPEYCQSMNSTVPCPAVCGSGVSPSGTVAAAAAGSVQNSAQTTTSAWCQGGFVARFAIPRGNNGTV